MKRKLFDKTLNFEINLIGYKEKGECILFFLKADGNIIYSGLVDCFVNEKEYVVSDLLVTEHVSRLDFVCWTHPHDDHTVGLDKIVNDFCDEKTLFWMSPFISKDVKMCSAEARQLYDSLFEILESKKKKRMTIREASDAKILEKFQCYGNSVVNPYIFEIRSFAPDSNLLASLKIKDRFDMGNIYSIGLIINVGHFYIILAGDVENRTIKCIPDFSLDIANQIDYIKIPHHSSLTASGFVDRLNDLDITAPAVATTTVYRIHKLPNKEILKKYAIWGPNVEIYSTGNVENAQLDMNEHGIIKTTFDILARNEIPIKTYLAGNAVSVVMQKKKN